MFDFFLHFTHELRGIDTEAIKKERLTHEAELRKDRSLFSKGLRRVIITLGVFFLILSAIMIILAVQTAVDVFMIFKYVVLFIVDIVMLVSLAVGKKKGEIAALISIIVFLLVLFITAAMG